MAATIGRRRFERVARLLRVVLVTDRSIAEEPLEAIVANALRGGATAVMLREKDLRGGELLSMAKSLRKTTASFGRALLVNERADVALASGADGVHLGSDAMPLAAVRAIAKRRIAGISVHSAHEGRARVQSERPDYVVVGPVFATPRRPGAPKKARPIGVGEVRRLRRAVTVPIVAIGGIDSSNAAEVVSAGADGVAAIRFLVAAADAEAAARSLRAAVEGALGERRAARSRRSR